MEKSLGGRPNTGHSGRSQRRDYFVNSNSRDDNMAQDLSLCPQSKEPNLAPPELVLYRCCCNSSTCWKTCHAIVTGTEQQGKRGGKKRQTLAKRREAGFNQSYDPASHSLLQAASSERAASANSTIASTWANLVHGGKRHQRRTTCSM